MIIIPSFPSCVNPQGEIKVSYSDGTHGIVGSSAVYTGKDTVYTLSDDTVTQCFCSTDGVGIQTDWWNASSLNDEEINILKSQGWYYIPAGNLWGLASAPYVAKNTNYSCLSGQTITSYGSSDQGSNNSSSNPSQANGIGGGDVLGLAATGNTLAILLVFAFSVLFIILGSLRLLRGSKNVKNF
jgi:hypothetical protein